MILIATHDESLVEQCDEIIDMDKSRKHYNA